MNYRWTVSAGFFLGVGTTLLSAERMLGRAFLDRGLSFLIWLIASLLGTGVSLRSLFLHADAPDPDSPLDHRMVGFISVALNAWPWANMVTTLMIWGLSPPYWQVAGQLP
jgi:hypothetical protein